jgi:molybdate-binding protein
LVEERYHLACLKDALDQPPVRALRDVLHNPAWQGLLSSVPGYAPEQCGEVLSLTAELPWWAFGRGD